MDPRHTRRLEIIQNLFAASFESKKNNLPFPKDEKTKKILAEKKRIDSLIQKYASKFPADKIAKTDLAILRLSVYDLISAEIPPKVVINEAVDLSKELSSDKAYGFVNAILGNIYKELYPSATNEK